MSKLNLQELEWALATAQKMREQEKAPDFIAKSFLNCHFQSGYLPCYGTLYK